MPRYEGILKVETQCGEELTEPGAVAPVFPVLFPALPSGALLATCWKTSFLPHLQRTKQPQEPGVPQTSDLIYLIFCVKCVK